MLAKALTCTDLLDSRVRSMETRLESVSQQVIGACWSSMLICSVRVTRYPLGVLVGKSCGRCLCAKALSPPDFLESRVRSVEIELDNVSKQVTCTCMSHAHMLPSMLTHSVKVKMNVL
eukprot:5536508-Amphidinium_carterae.2